MLDKVKFYQSSALLKSFRQHIPSGFADPALVEDYHSYLSDLQGLIEIDLSKFRVPSSAIKTTTSQPYASRFIRRMRVEPRQQPIIRTHCDADVLKRQVDAVLIFIETYLQDLKAELKKPPHSVLKEEEATIKDHPK